MRTFRHIKDQNPKTSFLNTRRADLDKKNNFLDDLKKMEQEQKLVNNLTRKLNDTTTITPH